MTCEYCGGHHDSDLCMGYNISSMKESVEEVNKDIELISEQNEEYLSTLVEYQDRNNELLQDGLNDLSYEMTKSSERTANELYALNQAIQQSHVQNIKAQLIVGERLSNALVGIGNSVMFRGLLDYAIQDEQLQFQKKKLKFEEEESSAGKARRELATAKAFLFSNLTKATEHINKSIEYFPSSAETFRIKSIIESRNDDHKFAIDSLQSALLLFEDEYYIPSIRKINFKLSQEEIDSLNISINTQLSLELSITGKYKDALNILKKLSRKFPNDAEIKVHCLRQLSHTPLWDKEYEHLIHTIILNSPKYFNLLFIDKQLKKKRKQVTETLKTFKQKLTTDLINKFRVASILKKRAPNDTDKINSYSYVQIHKLNKQLDNILKSKSR